MDDQDAAAHWAIRLDNGVLDAAQQAELDEWLGAVESRRGALLRAEAALAYLDRGRALAETDEPEGAYNEAPSGQRRRWLAAGLAATLALAGYFGLAQYRSQPLEIQTAVGELRQVTLADGSVASVNTNSRLAVAMVHERRDVRLEDGEVWFKVAPDKNRPFVVEAGAVRVRAVGTAFSVRKRADGADVLVTEGTVEVWLAGREADRTRIAAGSKSFVVGASPAIEVIKASGEIERALAWRGHELALNGESLDYAVAELNRYNTRKLVIEDPALGREPLVGYFRTDQPENFGRAVAQMFGARIKVEDSAIRLAR